MSMRHGVETRLKSGCETDCSTSCLFATLLPLILLLLLATGCKKNPSSATSNPSRTDIVRPMAIEKDVIASIHWLGKKQISAQPDSAGLMNIWKLPESSQLEAHILDKMALAPWRLAAITNAASGDTAPPLLRSLLDDLLQEEWYFELRRETNEPAALALAIHLNRDQAAAWGKALPTIVSSLNQETNQVSSFLTHLEIASLADWTLIGFGQQQNRTVAAMKARIERERHPFAPRATNFWVEAHVDLSQVNKRLPVLDPPQSPTLDLTMVGDGKDVLTRVLITFLDPINLNLDRWNIPVRLIPPEPLGLTALNGVAPLLAKSKILSGLTEGNIPNQLFFWDRRGIPLQMFFAFPSKNAQQTFEILAPRFGEFLQSHLPPGAGAALINTTNCTFIWDNLVFGSPFLHAVTNDGTAFVLGGFALPSVTRSNRMPAEIAAHILNATNLVFYDLESTGQRLSHWRYLDDTWRILSDASHAPRLREGSPGLDWIANCSSNLLYSTSELRIESPKTLTFARKSTVGFTALEIDLLANWVEMPSFPVGFSSFWATSSVPPAVIQRKSKPNR